MDNAVAALRLSSLPAVVWWRGGSSDALGDLADLADRLVLDTDDPREVWSKAEGLFEQTALTDLRMDPLDAVAIAARESVRRAAGARGHPAPAGADDRQSRRAHRQALCGWLVSTLRPSSDWQLTIRPASGEGVEPIDSVRLSSGDLKITLRMRSGSMEAIVDDPHACSRVVPLSDATLAT